MNGFFEVLMVRGVLLGGVLAVTGVGMAQGDYFSNWPAGVAPAEVGKKVAEHFVVSPHQYLRTPTSTIHYAEVGTWTASLQFAKLTNDTELRDKLVKRFEPLMPGGAEEGRVPKAHHVDASIFGIVPMEIGMQLKDAKYLEYGKGFADRQWENPLPDGLSAEMPFWIDDMYMLEILQIQAHRATGDAKYQDPAAKEMVA